ncbi:MAG TPA: hypothetical protein EYP39_01435 [Ghiorsea sp.]|nr:hypothetical protein [Ghiorsea sp.]HIP07441.1 hypothetical protein [Mariprofundaceae bacterium]
MVEWDENNLSGLGSVFIRNVVNHMRGREESTVRFGITGEGISPNYQVTFPNGLVRAIRGSSHEAYEQTDEFVDEKLSEVFSLADMQRVLERAR